MTSAQYCRLWRLLAKRERAQEVEGIGLVKVQFEVRHSGGYAAGFFFWPATFFVSHYAYHYTKLHAYIMR